MNIESTLWTNVIYAPSGQIKQLVQAHGPMNMALDGAVLTLLPPRLVNPQTEMVEGGELKPRPTPSIDYAALAAGQSVSFADLPLGAIFSVTNEAGDVLELTDFSDPLILVDAGKYVIRITAPFPWQAVEREIEVTDA